MKNRISNRIEEIRKTKNILQEELADALEVSRQTISSLENGRYNPSITLAFKIARHFDMKIEDVFIYDSEAKITDEDIAAELERRKRAYIKKWQLKK